MNKKEIEEKIEKRIEKRVERIEEKVEKVEELIADFEAKLKEMEREPVDLKDLTAVPDEDLSRIAGGNLIIRVNSADGGYMLSCPKCGSYAIRFKHRHHSDVNGHAEYSGYFDFYDRHYSDFFELIRQEESTRMVCEQCGFEGFYGNYYMHGVAWDHNFDDRTGVC